MAFGRVGARTCVEQEGGWNPDEGESPPPHAPLTLRAYLPADRTLPRRRARLDTAWRLLSLITPLPPLAERLVEQAQWEKVWKEGFQIVRVGRIVVRPVWETHTPQPGDLVLSLEPGLAFGTGHHPTTRLCLAWMQELPVAGRRILDLGTGSGILAIAAGLLGAERVVGLDIDAMAVRAARANVRLNGLSGCVRVQRGSLPWREGGQFHGIVANISAKVVCRLAAALWEALYPGGWLLASGILQEQQEEVAHALGGVGFPPPQVRREGEWVAMRTGRPSEKSTGQGGTSLPRRMECGPDAGKR
ncbi:MAG: 50S ribosomal protein L11 methyltransferase [Dehalococcoidia bacterium]|nr:50S ribosomal protein L11 methyltransferase [Dehalococcoidia bacterium]